MVQVAQLVTSGKGQPRLSRSSKRRLSFFFICLFFSASHAFPPVSRHRRWGGPTSTAKETKRASFLRAAQVLEFIEPTTGVPVKLVGAMHYNPASIRLAENVVSDLAARDMLGSVVIETCDIRWNSTLEEMSPLMQKVLQSEMRAAHDLALQYRRPVVLGDQRINVTVDRIRTGFVETAKDLIDPARGWPMIWGNITAARKEALPLSDGDNLNAFALLDPKLLLGLPVSFLKYPLSYIVKQPVASLAFFSLVFLGDEAAAAVSHSEPLTASNALADILGSALEIIVFGRIFLKELLAERNEVLAKSIREQCEIYQRKQGQEKSGVSWWPFYKRSDADSALQSLPGSEEQDKAVVAILGMAHCNGIMRLLKEQRV